MCRLAIQVVVAGCVTVHHVECVLGQQVKSSMLDKLQQLSRKQMRLLMLLLKGKTSCSHANGELCLSGCSNTRMVACVLHAGLLVRCRRCMCMLAA